jgi:hypothetical protein
MSKAGRPRKQGERFPSGRLRPERKAESAVYWQRERDVLRTTSRLSLLGTPIGMMFRAERLTASQFEAGRRFAEARSAADAALGLPPRNATAQDVSGVGGASNAIEDEDSIRRKMKAIADYDRTEAVVGYGSRELAALQLIVGYERQPDDYAQVIALVAGLNRLVLFYGMRG